LSKKEPEKSREGHAEKGERLSQAGIFFPKKFGSDNESGGGGE